MKKTQEQRRPDNKKAQNSSNHTGFGTYFTSKKGNRFYAKDYGYTVWPFKNKNKKR